jgi:hypothetical protein
MAKVTVIDRLRVQGSSARRHVHSELSARGARLTGRRRKMEEEEEEGEAQQNVGEGVQFILSESPAVSKDLYSGSVDTECLTLNNRRNCGSSGL